MKKALIILLAISFFSWMISLTMAVMENTKKIEALIEANACNAKAGLLIIDEIKEMRGDS